MVAAGFACERVEYGQSVEGRPLRAIALRAPGVGDSAPKVLVCANIHGPEFIGNRIAHGLLAAALAPTAPAPLTALLARAQLWIAPCLNPDGYARTWARAGRGALPELRHNARGVDLNRNWPLPAGARRLPLPGAGSDRPGDATYRGAAPLSEPETASLDALLAAQGFHASANLHSFMGTLFPARVCDRPSFVAYRQLCRALRANQAKTRYLRLASRLFDTFTGEQEDHQHHTRGCWSVCVESFPLLASFRQHLRAPALFWRFNPHDPRPWVDNDLPGVAAFLLASLDRPAPR
nr:M14 family metallopeptidase [Pseudenhygromyxa sp. WMMC2535]